MENVAANAMFVYSEQMEMNNNSDLIQMFSWTHFEIEILECNIICL